MTYLVQASGTATYPTRAGQINPPKDNWTAGKIQQVDDELIAYYNDHSDIFTVLSQNGASPTGLPSVTGLTAVDTCLDGFTHKTVFTLTDVAQTVTNGTEYQSTKIFSFPAGVVNVLGAVFSLAQKTTSAVASTINASSTGAVALGTVAASNVTLDSTMADIVASTAFTSSATTNVAGDAVGGHLATAAIFDGHTTAKDLYLNSSYATTTDVDGNGTQTWTGTITVIWQLVADY
jgi:hypothetical protein